MICNGSYDYSLLIAKIIERYGKREAFARAMGMTPCTLSHKLTGKKDWRQTEILRAAELLEIAPDEIGHYWFRQKGEVKEWQWGNSEKRLAM